MRMLSSDEKEEIKKLQNIIEEQRKLLKVQSDMIDVLSYKIGYSETKENIYDYRDRQKEFFKIKLIMVLTLQIFIKKQDIFLRRLQS